MKEFKEEHIEIRDKLKKLPRVKARENFLINLQHKINLAEAEPLSKASDSKNKSELFEKKFFPGRLSWLIPGLGMAAVVIIVFTFMLSRTQKDVSDNKETAVNKTELAPPATNTEIKTEESKDNLPGKDIAGDIRTERSEKNNVIMPTIQRGFNESISVEQEGGQSVIPPDKNINRPIQSDEKSIKKVENKDEPIRIIDKKDIETKSEPVKREEKLIKDKPKDSKSVEGITSPPKTDKKDIMAMPPGQSKGAKQSDSKKDKKDEKSPADKNTKKPTTDPNSIDKSNLEKLKEKIIDKK